MTSTGKEANGDPGNAELRLPRGDEIIFITPAEAARLWGPRVQKMAGATWIFNDGQCESMAEGGNYCLLVFGTRLPSRKMHGEEVHRLTLKLSTIITTLQPSF